MCCVARCSIIVNQSSQITFLLRKLNIVVSKHFYHGKVPIHGWHVFRIIFEWLMASTFYHFFSINTTGNAASYSFHMQCRICSDQYEITTYEVGSIEAFMIMNADKNLSTMWGVQHLVQDFKIIWSLWFHVISRFCYMHLKLVISKENSYKSSWFILLQKTQANFCLIG